MRDIDEVLRGIRTPAPEPSPHWEDAEDMVEAWVQRHGLTDAAGARALRNDAPGLFAGLVLPQGPEWAVFSVARYFAWLVLFDDAVETDALVLEAFKGGGGPGWYQAVMDTAPELPGFKGHVWDYVKSLELEASWRLTEAVPSLDHYLQLRGRTIGAQPILDVVEATHGVWPRDPVAWRLRQGLRQRAGLMFAWANDLIGFQACRTEPDRNDRLNLVSVLAQEQHLPVEAAKRVAAGLYRWEERALVEDLNEVRREVGAIRGLSEAYMAAVDGNLAWYQRSSRYASSTLAPEGLLKGSAE